jgi:predicted transcriptional regulator
MTTETRTRRSGVRLNPDLLDHVLALRALTARDFAKLAHVHEVTLSRARQGHSISESTLRRITVALLQIPPLAGADLLITGPETNKKVA